MPRHWSSSGADLFLALPALAGRRAGLETALRTAIRDGRLAPGAPLPSTRGLARDLGLSRGTVTAAYDQLAEEGYLTTRPGARTTVADLPPQVTGPRPGGNDAPEPRHDLRPGRPDGSAFPTRAWLASTRRVLDRGAPAALTAGDPQGSAELRAALADHLGRTRGVIADPDRVVITSGYYQGLALLCAVLHGGGARTAAVEDPSHAQFHAVVRRSGLTTVPLPVDAHGARVDALTRDAAAALVTPSHQYPSGVPLHPRRRRSLIAWARATGGLVIEDDYDGEFRYDRRPVGALQGIAPDHVVYCGTTSKTLGPALRLAWMVLPAPLVGPFLQAKADADRFTATLGQLVLADLIATHGYERYVRASRLRYRRRREVLLDRLAALPGLTVHGVPAGLHVLVTLPEDGPAERAALAACADRGVVLNGLTEMHHDPSGRPGGLLIGYAAPSDRAYPAALDALTAALAPFTRLATPR